MTENTPDAVKVLERLIATARLLYANAEGCAVNHHGADFELHGMPGWLTDCAADIAAAQSLGARAMQAAMARREVVQSLVESLVYGADMISEYLEKYHDYEGDTPAKSALRGIMHHLQGASLEPAGAQEGAEVPGPLYKRVEAILDEHSAWIARPNDEVTKRVALAAMFAAHAVLIEEEAPEDRYLRDGATHAPVISDETINTVRAHAIHHAAQGGMPQAEAEDHFGTPTPAGAGDLVERARNAERNITGRLRDAGWAPTRAGIESARNHIRDLASRIEALEAEVARLTRDLESADEEINDLQSECSSHENDDAKLEARATSAEAERDALKAEVGRLRRADMACRWYWPENSTESENCADSPQEVVQNAYGWEEPRGDVVAVARGGVVEVTYCAALPPAPDSDSDDEFWVEEATKEAATAKITAELERRAALSPAKAGG